MNKLTRTIHPEVKIIDRTKGIVDYVASDETLDSYREIIKADGWRFNRFQKNAPFVDSHDYSTVANLLGKVIDFKVEGKQLVERVQWAIDSSSELAKLGFSLTEGGYLKAVSVGFFPVRTVTKWDNDPAGFTGAISEMGISTEEATKLRAIYLEQEQIELSGCILGANPNALARAHIDGAVTDETLATLGFDDDDLQFLHESAAAYEEATPAQRAFIKLELRRIHVAAPLSRGAEARRQSAVATKDNFRQSTEHRATSPANAADGEEAIQRQRQAFLKELNRNTN
jgi:hypothetical protein